jgi:hypothetical protein
MNDEATRARHDAEGNPPVAPSSLAEHGLDLSTKVVTSPRRVMHEASRRGRVDRNGTVGESERFRTNASPGML